MIPGVVVLLGHAHWLGFIAAVVEHAPWSFRLGKSRQRPALDAGEPIYVVAFGKLRCRVPLSARRFEYPGPGYQPPNGERIFPACPAGGVLLGAEGYQLEVDDAGAAVGVTIDRAFPPWWPGAREPDWRAAPKVPAKGLPRAAEADEERGFPSWPVDGIPADLVEPVQSALRLARVVAHAPPPSAPARTAANPAISTAPGAASPGSPAPAPPPAAPPIGQRSLFG